MPFIFTTLPSILTALFAVLVCYGTFRYTWSTLFEGMDGKPFNPLYVIEPRSAKPFLDDDFPATNRAGLQVLIVLAVLFRSLRLSNPAVRLAPERLTLFQSLFRESRRPFPSWRQGETEYDHYENPIDSQRPKEVLVFGSRAALVMLPVRVIYNRVVCSTIWFTSVVVYLSGLVLFFLVARIIGIVNRRRLADERNSTKVDIFQEYVGWAYGPELNDNWYMEPGYFIFKALEGHQFRKAIAKFGVEHPNCEFGVWDALVSAIHLRSLDWIDAGCEMVENVPRFAGIHYKDFCHYSVENNQFGDGLFRNVYLIHVVDHIPDLSATFANLHRITATGGKVFFSGLSHAFSGYYLERVCAGGQIFNNRSLDWYEVLARKSGFKIVYQSYMQASLNAVIFKFTYPFIMRMHAWKTVKHAYFRFPTLRYRLVRFVEALYRDLFLLDEYFTEKSGKGLNFMIVMEKQ